MTKHTLGWHIKRIEIMLEDMHETHYWTTYGMGKTADKEFKAYMKQVNEEAEKK